VHRTLSEQNKIRQALFCLNCLKTILVMPRQQLLAMGDGDSVGDGQWRWQLRWLTVTETAMANGKGSSNGDGWR
jgi:hypothetical protein